MLSLAGFYIYCVFFIASDYLESMSFNTLNSFEKKIVANRKKLPFMTDFSSMVKGYKKNKADLLKMGLLITFYPIKLILK